MLLNGLIKQDVSLNHTDSSNYFFTPLIAASANRRDECVRVILQCPGVQVSEVVHAAHASRNTSRYTDAEMLLSLIHI